MSSVICTECTKQIRGKLLKHYRFQHPVLYVWAVRLGVTSRQTRRLFQFPGAR